MQYSWFLLVANSEYIKSLDRISHSAYYDTLYHDIIEAASKDRFCLQRMLYVQPVCEYAEVSSKFLHLCPVLKEGNLPTTQSFLIPVLVSTMDMRRTRRLTSISTQAGTTYQILPDHFNAVIWHRQFISHSGVDMDWELSTNNSWSCGYFRSVNCSMPE